MERTAAAEAIVAGGRRLGLRGLIVASEGNVSVRLDDGSLLVTPSGRRKDELTTADLVAVALDAARATDDGPRPTSDLAVHRAIYAARPDARAVAHAHLPAALAITLAGEVPDPRVLPETALFLPRLPFLAYGRPGSDELAARVAAAVSDGDRPPNAVLLERHGAVALGATVDEAVNRLELVDLLCRVWRDARAVAPDRAFAPPVAPA